MLEELLNYTQALVTFFHINHSVIPHYPSSIYTNQGSQTSGLGYL